MKMNLTRHSLERAEAEKRIAELETENAELREQLRVTESSLAERKRLLDRIPRCPVHGECVPHAINWVESMRAENAQLRERLEEHEGRALPPAIPEP